MTTFVRPLLCALVASAFLAPVAQAGKVRDLNKLLKGQYRISFTQSCISSFNGFDTQPPGGIVLGDANSGQEYITGIYTFDGAGNVRSAEKGIFLAHGYNGPGSTPITRFEGGCEGTYKVHPDLSVTVEYGCVTTATEGFNYGGTATVENIKLEGQLSPQANSLNLTNAEGAVRLLKFSSGLVLPQRCGAIMNGTRIR